MTERVTSSVLGMNDFSESSIRPVDPPRAEWVAAWDVLNGYAQGAKAEGRPIDPDELLSLMAELRRTALAPVIRWLKEHR